MGLLVDVGLELRADVVAERCEVDRELVADHHDGDLARRPEGDVHDVDRRHPCVRSGVVHLTQRKWPTQAVTPTSHPKPRGVSSAIDGGARRGHRLVRRGGPAETRPGARAVEFGRRQNHLRWGHRRSGLRLGVMEGHSDHQSGLPCVGSLGSEVSAPGPRVRVWYSSQRNG